MSSSWSQLVERWRPEVTDKAIRNGVFPSVPDLVTSIEVHVQASNENPKPIMWVVWCESILGKARRGRVAFEAITDERWIAARASGNDVPSPGALGDMHWTAYGPAPMHREATHLHLWRRPTMAKIETEYSRGLPTR